MVLRGKKQGFDSKRVKRAFKGLMAQEAKGSINLQEKYGSTKRRMVTKHALDEMGVKGSAKRQKVHGLVERIETRVKTVNRAGRQGIIDAYAPSLIEQLEAELAEGHSLTNSTGFQKGLQKSLSK